MVGDHHPLLPVTVSWCNKGVQYFYSKPCGHLMSFEAVVNYVNSWLCDNYIIIKVYKGKFQKSQLPLVSEIVIKYREMLDDDEEEEETLTTTITKGNCWSYKDAFDEKSDVIQEFNMNIFFNKFDIVSIN
jgi:hypothetical protein